MPLLVAAGITIGVGARTARLTISLTLYDRFSSQFDNSLQDVGQTGLTIQRQIDSLAAVVFQHRRRLDVLVSKDGGLCLFLQEECCFSTNQSRMVRNKIQWLQSDIQEHGDTGRPLIPG